MADLDLNRLSVTRFERIPGLTREFAAALARDREANGPFSSIEDVRRVPGFNASFIDSLRAARVAVSQPELPPPYMLSITVTFTGGAPASEHRVSARTLITVPAGNAIDQTPPPIPADYAALTDAEGKLLLTLPSRDTIAADVALSIVRPNGLEAATRTLRRGELPNDVAVEIEVPPALTLRPNDDPNASKPARLRGRVIDQRGERQVSGVQVILFGQIDGQDALPVAVARTDSAGYFSSEYPLGSYADAHAIVAVNGSVKLPIHLEGQAFPQRVLLVIDGVALPGTDDENCGCDGAMTPRDPDSADLASSTAFSTDVGQGSCVDFTRPDRTLQEFKYYYLVRTTEPNIQGFTVSPPPRATIRPELFETLVAAQPHMFARSISEDGEDGTVVATVASQDAIDLDTMALRKATRLQSGLTAATIADLKALTVKEDLARNLGAIVGLLPGRTPLTGAKPIDWDEDFTSAQATTIAHGHILDFKQEWIADGYSMGKVLYSLPLAPGQKKQIAVVDWERQEQAAREEDVVASDSLLASLSRDRDLGEIVRSTLSETMRGGSHTDSGSIGGGLGLGFIDTGFAGLLGIGGGSASASSTSWQDSSRSVAADSLQTLRDRTSQSASSLRAQRSTVVQSLAQGERTTVTTETVANYNHCHAVTVQYFEVLRHLIVRQRLSDVQECLFVPLQMSRFTRPKAMRWRNTLRTAVTDRKLREGFDAIERISANYEGADLPLGAYADDRLESISGELRLRFQLARPRDKEDGNFEPPNWSWMDLLLPFISPADWYINYLKDKALKDRVFDEQLGPDIARRFANLLVVQAELADGSHVNLKVDSTLVSSFRNDTPLTVTLRMSGVLPPVTRRQVRAIVISDISGLSNIPFLKLLPANSRVIVESAAMSYRTAHLSGWLVSDMRVLNDLVGADAARLDTSYLTREELRNPREEDKELARRLIDHLNEHIEHYHHAIWARMSPDRRYMLLDGFIAPHSGGRSVASVVENRLVGIVGNSIVLPVARGNHLDPTFNQEGDEPVDLLDHYQPNTPIEPLRVAIPTRGVYAEAVMGACNSCERKEEDRFWRWEESPIPDNPPSILPSSTDSRRADPPDLTTKDFAQPIIAMQSAPAAPDPTGLGAALTLLGQGETFRDITGLAGNQANVAAALKQAMETASTFGQSAANLALQSKMSKDVDRAVRQIEQAKDKGLISSDDASALTKQAIAAAIGGGATPSKPETTTDQLTDLTRAAGANQARISVQKPGGEAMEVDARPLERADSDNPRPLIIFPDSTVNKEVRCFNPTSHDISGRITLEAQVKNMPTGGSVIWWRDTDHIRITGDGAKVTVDVRRPGPVSAGIAVRDANDVQLASTTLKLSVPRYIKVMEDTTDFKAALAALKIDGRRDHVLKEARAVVNALLFKTNVRVVWNMPPFLEDVPGGYPSNFVTIATLRNEPPSGQPRTMGETFPSASGGPDALDATINIYPGAYDNPPDPPIPTATMVDTETQALLIQIASEPLPSAALMDFAVKVFGRLLGETLAHEIVHALLWNELSGPGGHNDPMIPNDLMNRGGDRPFQQRTGLEDTAHSSPLVVSNFVDHGIATIGGLQAVNQGLMDAKLPVADKL